MKRIWTLTLLVVVLVQGTSFSMTHLAEAGQTGSSVEPSFFLYLTDTKKLPTLIGYSPSDFDPRHGRNFHLPSPASIKKDLTRLREVFDGLTVYSYHPDVTPLILQYAKQLGYRAVMLGIWDARSATEIKGVVKLIREYANDMSLAVCLGNEGLYFGRYSMEDLYEAQKTIHDALGSSLKIPISTSEPWVGYRDSSLYAFGDFLAPNIHPVWEKPALPAKDAVFWTRTQAMHLMETSQKPVLVKETGFPHAGERHFTPQSQKQFWEMYVREDRLVYSRRNPRVWVSFAASFEAFSLPWKAEQSGEPIEAAWGLMTKDRNPFPAFYILNQRYPAPQP